MRLLNDLGGFPSPEVDILAEQAAEMGDDELDRMRDTDLVDVLRSISGFYPEHVWPEPGDPAQRFPQAAAALERVWTERAKQLAVDLYVAGGLDAVEQSVGRASTSAGGRRRTSTAGQGWSGTASSTSTRAGPAGSTAPSGTWSS